MVLVHAPLLICMRFQPVRHPYISLHADTHNHRCHIDIYLFSIAVFLVALGNLPPVSSVREVWTLGLSDSVTTPLLLAPDDRVTIVAELPLYSSKLVSRIEAE